MSISARRVQAAAGQSDGSGGGNPPPSSSTQIYFEVSKNGDQYAGSLPAELDRVAASLGVSRPIGNYMKFFDGGKGLADAATDYENSGYMGIPVLCHKVDDSVAYNNRLDQLTAPEVWVYYHEWEKSKTAAEMNVAYLNMDQARRNHANGHFVSLLIDGATYQEEHAWPDKFKGLDPAAAHVEYLGMDVYRSGAEQNKAPDVVFAKTIDQHNYFKGTYPEYKGFCVPEFGLGRNASDGTLKSPQARADELAADFQWLRDQGCVWINYWEEDNSSTEGVVKDWRCAPDDVVKQVLVSNLTRL